MKKKIPFLIAFVAMALLPACKNVVEQEPKEAEAPRFIASISDVPEPRVFANREEGVLYMVWHADDEISIFERSTRNRRYHFLGNDGDHRGDFEEVVTSGTDGEAIAKNVAVYPYNSDYTCDSDGKVSLSFPGSQSYRADNLDPSAAIFMASSDDNKLSFYHLGGYLVLQLYGEGVSVKSLTLEANDHQPLSGPMTAWVNGQVVEYEFAASGTSNSITLTAETPVQLGATSSDAVQFWFCVPPVEMSDGFTITVLDTENNFCVLKSEESFSFAPSKLFRMKPRQVVTVDSEIPAELGIYYDGSEPVLFQPAIEQFSVYKAEGQVWIRMFDPAAMTMYQLGPVPENAAPGDVFNASLDHNFFNDPSGNTSAAHSLKVVSVGDHKIALRDAGKAWFILRF